MNFKTVKLGKVAEINPRRPTLDFSDEDIVTFVPMESIDEITGTIVRAVDRTFAQVKKGYTVFTESDVIFAKITPCMQNGKHALAQNLIRKIGFGSTEFHIIWANEDIAPEWIHSFLRHKKTLDAATKTFTGTIGQQRVPSNFLTELEIPLPPIDQQRRIAAQLKAQLAAVEEARQAAQAQISDAKRLITAILEAAFAVSVHPLTPATARGPILGA
ncbi:MAG: restriction endonuclease subunit S, partial [Candidatus Methylumidiphilus sp.]